MNTLYDILEVAPTCTIEDIRKNYLKLVKKHHPDCGGSNNRFQEIQNAYRSLCESEERRKKDIHERWKKNKKRVSIISRPLLQQKEMKIHPYVFYIEVTLQDLLVGVVRRVHSISASSAVWIEVWPGARHGDLVFDEKNNISYVLKVKPHSVFTKREGSDLHCYVSSSLKNSSILSLDGKNYLTLLSPEHENKQIIPCEGLPFLSPEQKSMILHKCKKDIVSLYSICMARGNIVVHFI